MIYITKSETFNGYDTKYEYDILNETIKEFEIKESDIISINLVENNGQKRFVIYHRLEE